MAWVGTTTAYNQQGDAIQTFRVASAATETSATIAQRVSAEVAHLVSGRESIPVQCVQDGALELGILPATLRGVLPTNTPLREVVDFEHVMGYLDDVVDACDPEDRHNRKGWYRRELLRDDCAIDRIFRNLRRKGSLLGKHEKKLRKAVAAAISYIRRRRDKMRYATYHAQKLAIGSGATEGTCSLMQARVKRRGQSWRPKGLRGVLVIRALVQSNRWRTAWNIYAATKKTGACCAA